MTLEQWIAIAASGLLKNCDEANFVLDNPNIFKNKAEQIEAIQIIKLTGDFYNFGLELAKEKLFGNKASLIMPAKQGLIDNYANN